MACRRIRFAQRRRAAGYSQDNFAEAIKVDRSTVVRWEAGETEPQPYQRRKIAQVLSLDLAELDALLSDTSDDEEPQRKRRSDVLASPIRVDPNKGLLDFALSSKDASKYIEEFTVADMATRREFMYGVSLLTGSELIRLIRQWAALVPADPQELLRIGHDELSQLEQSVAVFRAWDSSGTGGLHRKAVVGHLNAVAETLTDNHPPAINRRLFQVAAELAQLAGWMTYDVGLPDRAQRYYLLALHACQQAEAVDLGAKIVGDMAQMSTSLGHYSDSLALVQTALASLPRHASPMVRSELLGLEARAYAQLGSNEASNVRRAAETCVEVFNEAPSNPRPGWIHYMNQSEVDCLAANAYIGLALHEDEPKRAVIHAERAEQHARAAIESRGRTYIRSRVLDEIRLSNVRLAQTEAVEAATIARNALHLATNVSSVVVMKTFIRLSDAFTLRYPDVSAIKEFQSELFDYVQRVAPGRERGVTKN